MGSGFTSTEASVLSRCIGLTASHGCVARARFSYFAFAGVETVVDLAVAIVVEFVIAGFFGGEDLVLAIGPFAVDAKL